MDQFAEPGNKIALPARIATDLKHFFDLMGGEVVYLPALGFRSANLEAIIDDMRKMYGVG